ncbi:hypothetical protein FGRMN_4619 [Fusarium graminum]|nr:hypothetical protein FGRMN_4619 [Fusarium graminum]
MDAFVTRLPKPQSQLRNQVRPDSPDKERPSKRAKRQGSSDSGSDRSHDARDSQNKATLRKRTKDAGSAEPVEGDHQYGVKSRPTDIESALPPAAEGEEAIEAYEVMKSSQATAEEEDGATEQSQPRWVRGQSSIYVDAFNLALDTVLEDESHLFDDKESEVFKQWRELNYEAQYLYVRLFLRKTATWHRHSRLGYRSDISDLEAAIATLQSSRTLPHDGTPSTQNPIQGIEFEESGLGEVFTFADSSEDHINSVEEAASQLSLDELKDLAREAKTQGRNKAELIHSLVRMSKQQTGLMSVGLSRHNSRDSAYEDQENRDVKARYEAAIRMEAEVDAWEFNSPPGEKGLKMMVDIFDRVYPRWKVLVEEEQRKEHTVYEAGEGAYLRRFTPGHSYTRIVHKAAPIFGKLKEHLREYELLTELLDQRLFHPARRGSWYQRKALLEEHYMPALDPNPRYANTEQQKKHWKRIAVDTCEAGLQDPDCHLIFHYDLQKRLVKLEQKLRIPRRLQHDFGHVGLQKPIEHTIEGIQIKKDAVVKPGRQASTKTIWFDELDSKDECNVEAMCLSQYRSEGWKGYHAEGGIIRTLFAYLFYDILFIYIPNVFQTAYQTCPLDLHTDAFYPSRASEINHRLVEIANGEGSRLIREVWDREYEKRTSVIGLNWDFEVDDLVELVECFEGNALAAVCKVMAQEYRQRGGGIPDLVLWRTKEAPDDQLKAPGQAKGEVMFSEVKSANDRLSDTQRLWIHVLTGAGVKVALCKAVAKEVRELG